jgi:RNA polymerase sigma-70 factor (ECF subfamily)
VDIWNAFLRERHTASVRRVYGSDERRRTDVTVDEHQWLAERFEADRAHLRGVAYRMLGSVSDADDAVQEFWLRLSRSGADGVENLRAWCTTGVARVCLDMLRSRRARREEPFGPHVPDPIVGQAAGADPEHEVLLADSVGLALLVVLEELTPAERLAFVLHDMFAVPFDEIAALIGRTPAAARQLASRARRRVQGAPVPDADLDRQRVIVDAFLAAARSADFDALVAVLAPDVVLHIDRGERPPGASTTVRGARAVAERGIAFSRLAPFARPALVNRAAGFVVARSDRLLGVAGFTIARGKIAEIDLLMDRARLRDLPLRANLDGAAGVHERGPR